MELDQPVDSQINKRLFLLSLCQMKKIMRISANQLIPIDTKVANVGLDQATTEKCRLASLSSLKVWTTT